MTPVKKAALPKVIHHGVTELAASEEVPLADRLSEDEGLCAEPNPEDALANVTQTDLERQEIYQLTVKLKKKVEELEKRNRALEDQNKNAQENGHVSPLPPVRVTFVKNTKPM